MSTHADAERAIGEYELKFRCPQLGKLDRSGLYDLFPSPAERPADVQGDFRDPWPFSHRAGVYLVFDADRNLLYVGKASDLGDRLYDHFRDEHGVCQLMDQDWDIPAKYIVTVAVPVKYEALALEGFLIETLHTRYNKQGVRRE